MLPLSLRGTIGFGHDNDAGDVSALAEGLGRLGYREAAEAAATGEWSGDIGSGLRRYQSDRGLAVDGWAAPGGQTETAMNDDLLTKRTDVRADDARGSGPGRAELDWRDSALFNSPPWKNEIVSEENASNHATKSAAGLGRLSQRDGIDRSLERRGYRYRPDPMGRVGEGDWLDSRGRALSRDERERIEHDLESAQSGRASTEISPESVPNSDAERDDQHVTIEIEDDEADQTDEDEGAAENGQVEPANLLDRILQGLFSRGNRRVWLRQGKLPPSVKRRVEQIKSERTRHAVELLLDGSDDETKNPNNQNAISAFKRSGIHGAHFDFGRFMTRMGMRNSDALPVFEDGKKDGKKIGKRFTDENGVTVILRFLDRRMKENTSIEIQIPKPSGKDHRTIKLRYRAEEFVRGKR